MAFQRLTSGQRRTIDALRTRAWAAGLVDATFSQIAKDPSSWELEIRTAEAAKAKAERQAAAPTSPVELIATLRAAGVTVRQIAQAAGVHTSTVYRWARGTFRPQASRMTALATLTA